MTMDLDIAFVGNYTKDTIVTPQEIRKVHGGAFLYGAYVVAQMGLKAAVVTRLAREDFEAVEDLVQLGVEVFAKPTSQSTCLRLVYPTADLDQRSISIEGNAGAFTVAEVVPVQARVFHIGASIRGEVSPEVIEALAQKEVRISLDVQGFIRINRDGKLVHDSWPEQARVLKLVNVLKTDGVEAEILTGEKDIKEAAKILADFGPQEIILTHRDGVLVYAEGRFYETPFFPREVRGRTGRGDTCTAAYLGKRLTAPPAEATIWAAALTSLKMEQGGPFCQEISEVEALIKARY
jgi:sugar/nucleoside kinase (ribokinase family)